MQSSTVSTDGCGAGEGQSLQRPSGHVDLVGTLHVAVAPVELGAGSRLSTSPDELDDRHHHDVVPRHHLLRKR